MNIKFPLEFLLKLSVLTFNTKKFSCKVRWILIVAMVHVLSASAKLLQLTVSQVNLGRY